LSPSPTASFRFEGDILSALRRLAERTRLNNMTYVVQILALIFDRLLLSMHRTPTRPTMRRQDRTRDPLPRARGSSLARRASERLGPP